ncbi:RNA polymerase sigma factor [Prauserella muralis]|uniref:Uncharacterized protein n=1 Tax=Prauserella muralis TaxID=588067 RepID=A0A2V4AF07_9PSEU|nr:sigma-70 family RNA polymerase sigma factor [Prauserella muralis]PXY16587.1 hypothetical protein BAY60_35935 [Prauserella muralis]TWE11169.1 DNA-directed RNA polymerase specialized sigma24 family protein [Prauserella muralis]
MQARARAAGDSQQVDVAPDDASRHTTPIDAQNVDFLGVLEAEDDEVRRRAESLQRRLRDRELREELVAEDFGGPAWKRFAEELARYGVAVMLAWLRTGEIFVQCKRKGWPVGTSPSTWRDDDQIDLAHDTVVAAINLFKRDALKKGGWSWEGGASLKTYFIGACVLSFPSIYRVWRNHHADELKCSALGLHTDLETTSGDLLAQRAPQPETIVTLRHQLEGGLDELPDPRTRTAVLALALGYSYDEIAEILSTDTEVSRGTVAQLLIRHRRRIGKGTDQ